MIANIKTAKRRRQPWMWTMLLVVSSIIPLNAQSKYIDTYDWDHNPELHKLSAPERSRDELMLMENTILEYVYDKELELREYVLYHKITRVNSRGAIESNNRIYLIESESSNIIEQKARVIKPDGSVKLLKKEDIIEATDEESKQKYKYFALEGMEKGSEIEYLYKMEIDPVLTGTSRVLQSGTPRKDVTFSIITPPNLLFETKSLNGLPDMAYDTTVFGDNILKVSIDSVPALKKEEFAIYRPNLMQVLYKLGKNKFSSVSNVINFKGISQDIYELIYSQRSKSLTKAVKSFIKGANPDNAKDEMEKIRKIENYIKTNIFVTDQSAPELSDVGEIINKKMASHIGIIRLYAEIFDLYNIEHELVLTSDRNKIRFDKEFEMYSYLDDYLFYFPGPDLYMTPILPFYRLGFVPDGNIYNYGLFIKRITVGDLTTGIGVVKFIEAPAYNKTMHNLFIHVDFSENVSNPKIDMTQELTGYYAQYFQPYYDIINAEQTEEFNKKIVENTLGESEIHKIETENASMEDFGVKPFILKAETDGNLFVENAGDVLLFKLGELLGPQSELYQETERKLDIENDFNRQYIREITFNIPSGYKAKNLDVLNFNVVPEGSGKDTSMAFISSYTVDGDKVKVGINEYYKQIAYPLSTYDSFRKVINAAADFNKIVIIFEPEK